VRSVRVYALRPEIIAELPSATVPTPASQRRRIVPAATTAAAAAGLVIAVIAWWFWPPTRSFPTPPEVVGTASESAQTAPSVIEPAVAPRLSIVVLPFANLSNDPEQQYFADGITEDLTTDLSRISHMLVISRNSAFTYKDKPVNAKQIGRELGVRYVLEGSVRRLGSQVRVSAQLIDAATDTHLWAERFDRDTGDLFALQNDITRQIAIALNSQLVVAEARRPTEHPDAGLHSSRTRRITPGSHTWQLYRSRRPVRASVGPRVWVGRGADLVSGCSRRSCEQRDDHHARRRYRTGQGTDRAGAGEIARQHPCAFSQRSGAARRGPVRPRHSRI
jgi:TolB-like protein